MASDSAAQVERRASGGQQQQEEAAEGSGVVFPPIELAKLRTKLTRKLYVDDGERGQLMEKCSAMILAKNMAPLYRNLCEDLKIEINETTLQTMKVKNERDLAKLEETIEQAQSSGSEVDIKKMLIAKADYLMNIGHKDEPVEVYESVIKSNPTTEMKVGCLFKICFIYFFHGDFVHLKKSLQTLEEVLINYSSWEEKNRLKVYKGLYYLALGKFSHASALLIDTIPTFNTSELISYEELVCYAVSLAMLTLSRRDLKLKCVDGQEVQEGLYGSPLVKNFLKSLYNCAYKDFFENLVLIENKMKNSFYMHNVYQIYVDEIRAVAYAQLLESYSSLGMDYMANLFGVTPEFMDKEISYYINRDKLNCKINKVTRTINTTQPNMKNNHYKQILREGDFLLSQLQKLARKVNA